MTRVPRPGPDAPRALKPEPPFLWPEPRVLTGQCSYLDRTAVEHLCAAASSMFGVVTALTETGIELVQRALETNPTFQCRLVVSVYPTCGTRESDLEQLDSLANGSGGRLEARVHPYTSVQHRPTNAVCIHQFPGEAFLVIGPSENFGLDEPREGKVALLLL